MFPIRTEFPKIYFEFAVAGSFKTVFSTNKAGKKINGNLDSLAGQSVIISHRFLLGRPIRIKDDRKQVCRGFTKPDLSLLDHYKQCGNLWAWRQSYTIPIY